MYEIISALRRSSIVLDVEVLEVIDEDSVKLIKIKAVLKDDCIVQRQLHLPIDDNYTYPFLATIKILPRVLNLGMEVLRHPRFQRSFLLFLTILHNKFTVSFSC